MQVSLQLPGAGRLSCYWICPSLSLAFPSCPPPNPVPFATSSPRPPEAFFGGEEGRVNHPCISHLFPGAASRQKDVGKALDGKDDRTVSGWNPDPNVKWGAMAGHCRARSEGNSWSALGRDHSQTSGNHTLEEDQPGWPLPRKSPQATCAQPHSG